MDAKDSAFDIDIVDDDVTLNQLFCAVADSAGFKTRSYYSAEQYLEYVNSTDYVAPKLVVMTDIKMQGKTGYELIGELRKVNAKQCYIVVTGTPEAVNHSNVKACFYLTKPVDILKLQTIFNKLLLCNSNYTKCQTAEPLCKALSNLDDFEITDWHCPQQFITH